MQSVFQVSEIVHKMRTLLETQYKNITIEGEIASITKAKSGHFYFNLQDENSQISCVLFKGNAYGLGFIPKTGDLVQIHAQVSIYKARGSLQCIAQSLTLAGDGALLKKFEQVKQRLQQSGIFDAEHKKKLPYFISHVGIITSATGAVVHDIVSTLQRLSPCVKITIYSTLVQGNNASEHIQQAFKKAILQQNAQVLILARGGGSVEDLWCFNNETLVQQIHQCPIPVISAIGHETDFTLSDFVADIRAATPTAAAEIISQNSAQLKSRLAYFSHHLPYLMRQNLRERVQKVDLRSKDIEHPRLRLQKHRQKLLHFADKIILTQKMYLQKKQQEVHHAHLHYQTVNPRKSINSQKENLKIASEQLQKTWRTNLTQKQQLLRHAAKNAHAFSPLATIDRGFSISKNSTGEILRKHQQIQNKEKIYVEISNANLICQITNIQEKT